MEPRSNPRICIAEKLFAAEVLLAQSAGEGKRLGRSFSSPSGGLYFSIPIPPSFISDPALITAKGSNYGVAGGTSLLYECFADVAEVYEKYHLVYKS